MVDFYPMELVPIVLGVVGGTFGIWAVLNFGSMRNTVALDNFISNDNDITDDPALGNPSIFENDALMNQSVRGSQGSLDPAVGNPSVVENDALMNQSVRGSQGSLDQSFHTARSSEDSFHSEGGKSKRKKRKSKTKKGRNRSKKSRRV